MLEELTSDSVFSQVMMEEPPPRAVLLVEGPDEDTILFEHLAEGVVRIIAGGKKSVLGAAQTALDTGMATVFGLVDRDLDALRGRTTYPANVVVTDAYDLIADLVAVLGHDVLRRVMNAHAAPSVRTIETATGRSVVDTVFDLTGPLGAVRLAALRNHYPLVLKHYDFRHVVTTTYGAADLSVYVENAVCQKPEFMIDSDVIESVRNALPEVGHRSHSGGHDLVAASVAVVASGGSQISKKAVAGNIMSFATCDVLASIPCLQALNATARSVAGIDLIDCLAA